MSHDFNRRAGRSAEFSLKTVRILAVVLFVPQWRAFLERGVQKVLRASLLLFVFLNVRCSQTQDLASVSSVRTTGFEVRNLNTVVRFHHTSLSKFIKNQVIPYLSKVGKK